MTYRSQCKCDCHKPGIRMLHIMACCSPDPIKTLDYPGLNTGAYLYSIFYKKKPEFCMLEVPTTVNLEDYAELGVIAADDHEDVFVKMQGEMWSPNEEARSLILAKDLRHTSMSVSDLLFDHYQSKYFMVISEGFQEVSVR